MRSEALGVSFLPVGSFLRARDLWGGKVYRWHTELVVQANQDAEVSGQADEVAAREVEARKGPRPE